MIKSVECYPYRKKLILVCESVVILTIKLSGVAELMALQNVYIL
jgi:hypothetical protein